MDWFLVTFFIIMIITLFLIGITFISLVSGGDERKKLIKTKAQSYAFIVVILFLFFEISKSIYLSLFSNNNYEGLNPYTLLVTISITYLITLLVYKKKYGD